MGGQSITGTTDDTVYVPNLNIGIIGSGAPVGNLGFDSSGNVVTGLTSGNLFTSTERSLNNATLNFSGATGATGTYTIQNPYSDDPNSMLTGSTLLPSTGGTFTGKTYTLPSGTLNDGDILNFKLKFSRVY